MKKKVSKGAGWIYRLLMMLLMVVMGTTSGVMMADATDLPDAGKTENGNGEQDGAKNAPGISSETAGREYGAENFYLNEVDAKIVKMRPMNTPIDNISRYATASKSDSFVVKYYSVGTRPIECTLSEAVEEQTSGTTVKLTVDDTNMFTVDDTIRVVGVKGIYDENGVEYDADKGPVPDLVLSVCAIDIETGLPIVYAVNGNMDSSVKKAIWLPAIPEGTTLIRMGKACAELDAQTGRFNNIPTAEEQYCQNFMMQVEETTFNRIAAKEVNWNFNELEEDAMYDLRVGMENSWLFGVKNVINHPVKKSLVWFTKGIWWMAGKDLDVGRVVTVGKDTDEEHKEVIITDDDLVDLTKELFDGTDANKQKLMFCGSDFLATLSKIKSKKFIEKDTVEIWNLRFKRWETEFGDVLTIHHQLLDLNGMSDQAFAMDPSYLYKKTHLSFAESTVDLKAAGVRNSKATILQEVSCIYLRYPKAHARLQLVAIPDDGDGASPTKLNNADPCDTTEEKQEEAA